MRALCTQGLFVVGEQSGVTAYLALFDTDMLCTAMTAKADDWTQRSRVTFWRIVSSLLPLFLSPLSFPHSLCPPPLPPPLSPSPFPHHTRGS